LVPPGRTRRVLLVDDDEAVRKSIARQLRAFGYVADMADDGKKATLMASAYEYQVIVSDLLMPQVNGIELISHLAQRSATTSFILMTGAGDFGAHDSQAVDGRLTTVLAKPIDERDLERALTQAFEFAEKRRVLASGPEGAVRLLLLEDSKTDALLLQHALEAIGGYEVTHVTRLSEAVGLLHESAFDTVITDLTLPDARGLGAVLRLRDCAPDSTLLVCSSVGDEAMALRVIELGAQDFIVKGVPDAEGLGRAIRFARVHRQAERRLAHLAHADPLTGLWNRAAFDERLDQELAQARRHGTRLGVMYIDLDGFKAVNDVHGHDIGDELLKQSAARIRRWVRDYDAVARLGGDEFAVLATNLPEGSFAVTAERIGRALAAPVATERGPVQVTASIGIASFPEDAEEAVLLIKAADEAMYAAKRSGKNCVSRGERSAPRSS
jgi:diguanylate cyclase (GGDEF)-like protein